MKKRKIKSCILMAIIFLPILIHAQYKLKAKDFYIDSNIYAITYNFAPDVYFNTYADSLKQLIDCSFKKDILHVMENNKALLGLHILLAKKYTNNGFVALEVTSLNKPIVYTSIEEIIADTVLSKMPKILEILEFDTIKWKQVNGLNVVSYRQRRLIRRKWKKYFDCNCP
jgi:hypothetical protein